MTSKKDRTPTYKELKKRTNNGELEIMIKELNYLSRTRSRNYKVFPEVPKD